MMKKMGQHKGKKHFRRKKMLIVITITVVLSVILLNLINSFSSNLRGAFWKSVPEYSDLSEKQIIISQYVKGYQIMPNGDEIVFLTGTETYHDVYSWDSIDNTLKKLNLTSIPSDISSFNNASYRATEVAFVDEENNIYFESGNHLIKIDSVYKVTVYDYLTKFLHTSEELTTKAVSNLNKRIIEKYSKEQIVALKKYDSSVVAYLIEIDGKHYYDQYDTDCNSEKYTLSRFSVEGETVENLQSNEHRIVEYDQLWDPITQKVDPKGKISQVTETVVIDPKILVGTEIRYPKIPHVLDYGKHRIINGSYKASIQCVCYKELIPLDNPCRARRTLLNIKSHEYVLPNFEVIYGDVLLEEQEDTSFIYVPYNNRFFTTNGKFIFLSQDNKLFAL